MSSRSLDAVDKVRRAVTHVCELLTSKLGRLAGIDHPLLSLVGIEKKRSLERGAGNGEAVEADVDLVCSHELGSFGGLEDVAADDAAEATDTDEDREADTALGLSTDVLRDEGDDGGEPGVRSSGREEDGTVADVGIVNSDWKKRKVRQRETQVNDRKVGTHDRRSSQWLRWCSRE
jgi:hypothetical protein